MSTPPPEPLPELNPYAPPEASLGEAPAGSADLAEAEAIRRAHIAHETSIRSLGFLHLLGGVILLLLLATVVAATFGTPAGERRSAFLFGMVAYVGFLTAINFALGVGLRGLRPWARWTDAVLIILSLLFNLGSVAFQTARGTDLGSLVLGLLASALIPGYILYLLLSPRGGVVFSAEYQSVIARTPHVKMRTSWLVKGCLIVLVVFLVVLALGGVGSFLFRPR